MQQVVFDKKGLFFNELKSKVDLYFELNDIKKTGNNKLYFKAACLSLIAVVTYVVLVFFTPSTLVSLSLCALLGMTWASIGFNIMHESAHGSFSNRKWLNEIMGYSFNAIGGSVYMWKQKHNVNHHTYTNIEGFDDDIDIKPWIRVHKDQRRFWYHKFQHLYWVVLYGATYLLLVYVQDFKKYFSGKVGTTPLKKLNSREHFIFWFSKLAYFAVYIGLPAMRLGLLQALVGYFVASLVCGFVIAIIFQLAHVVQHVEFSTPSSPSYRPENEWAIHQIKTTANFATKNKVLGWFSGGLTHQIEHHLFPRISHVHYSAISGLVSQTCKDFGISYLEFPSVLSALRSHIVHLKEVGQCGI